MENSLLWVRASVEAGGRKGGRAVRPAGVRAAWTPEKVVGLHMCLVEVSGTSWRCRERSFF